MATPTLRRDQHFHLSPTPAPMVFSTHPHSQQWPLTDNTPSPVSRFRSATDLNYLPPMLPTIASLLNNESTRDELETRKRKLQHRKEPRVITYTEDVNIPVVSSAMRRAVYREFGPASAVPVEIASPLPSSDSRSRVRPTPVEISSRYLQRDPPREHDAERRRLYYHHDLDPHKIHEIHIPAEIPHYYEPRKHGRSSRYHRPHVHSAYYDRNEEMEMNVHKRRRVTTSPTPRQPLYESGYGLTVLETSKPLRYPSSMESGAEGDILTSRQRYVRDDSDDFETINSPIPTSSRIYKGSERGFRPTESKTSPTPRTHHVNVEKNEPSSLTTLVLKSKEFLKSKSLVRNRHDEIDWVATFLNVGFDSSSIYALMCPLRKGRWKSEEENYTMGLLRLIENGTILLRHGQSIRGYIGEKLHSDDMRVLKKLSNCKMFHFAKLINPRLAEEEKLDMSVEGARGRLEELEQLKGDFLRSVQLEALVAVRKYLSDSSLRDLLNVRA